MSFKISCSYKVREGLIANSNISAPVGTVEDFVAKVTELLERFSDEPEFRFEAKFG
jgi:hypothetical protein